VYKLACPNQANPCPTFGANESEILFHIYVVALPLEKCQQDEGLELKNFNMLKFLQVFYKIEVSIK